MCLFMCVSAFNYKTNPIRRIRARAGSQTCKRWYFRDDVCDNPGKWSVVFVWCNQKYSILIVSLVHLVDMKPPQHPKTKGRNKSEIEKGIDNFNTTGVYFQSFRDFVLYQVFMPPHDIVKRNKNKQTLQMSTLLSPN